MDTDLDGTQVLVPNSIVVPQQPTKMATPPAEALEVAPSKHKCDICFQEFRSGQALGGHKSKHFRESEAISNATPSINYPICCLVCGNNFDSTKELSRHHRCHTSNMYISSDSSSTVSDETMFDDGVDSGTMDMTRRRVDYRSGPGFESNRPSLSSPGEAKEFLCSGWSRTGKRTRAASSGCSGSDAPAVNSSPELKLAIVDRKFEEETRGMKMLAEVCSEETGGRILVDDDEIEIKNVKEDCCKGSVRRVPNLPRTGRKLNDAAVQLDNHSNNDIDRFGCKLCDKKFSSYQALGGHMTSHNRPKINSADNGYDNDPVVNEYTCSDCDRTFSTHQALGGHISSHKKNKKNNNMDRDQSNSADMSAGSAEDNKIEPQKLFQTVPHQCEVCGNIFPTGQALGGHKRLHYKGPAVAQATPSQQSSSRRHLEIDLNEPPPMEDEDGLYDPSLVLKLN